MTDSTSKSSNPAATTCFNAEKIEALRRALPERGDLERGADRHKAIGHPSRLAILHLLALEDCCVCDLAHALEMPMPTVSRHLARLRTAGLVSSRQDWKFVIYSLAEPLRQVLVAHLPMQAGVV